MKGLGNSFLKACVWRIIASSITAILALLITGDISSAMKVGIADLVIKIIVFTGFDWSWTKFFVKKD